MQCILKIAVTYAGWSRVESSKNHNKLLSAPIKLSRYREKAFNVVQNFFLFSQGMLNPWRKRQVTMEVGNRNKSFLLRLAILTQTKRKQTSPVQYWLLMIECVVQHIWWSLKWGKADHPKICKAMYNSWKVFHLLLFPSPPHLFSPFYLFVYQIQVPPSSLYFKGNRNSYC